MTNAQKWVTAFLGLFLILFLLERVTKKEEPAGIPLSMSGQNSRQNAKVTSDADGPALMQQIGCVSCHGVDLKGTQMAPALLEIKKNWSRDELINYLRNPSSYNGGERFDQYRASYKNVIMPSFSNIDVKELGKIADYLLNRNE
jgi:mono/diheme cytochrome c family protein